MHLDYYGEILQYFHEFEVYKKQFQIEDFIKSEKKKKQAQDAATKLEGGEEEEKEEA